MRRLLYVPVVHDEADMGSAGRALRERSAALTGEQRWSAHQRTMSGFWKSIADFVLALPPDQLKVYQDGLAAEGQAARRVVQEAARRGSQNYLLVLELLGRGAEPRKTEDHSLLLQEYENSRRDWEASSRGEGEGSAGEHRLEREGLTEARDRFIAAAIDATLKPEELGLLFIGAYHDVMRHLPADISVVELKDTHLVREYFKELLHGHDNAILSRLARHLASPITATI